MIDPCAGGLTVQCTAALVGSERYQQLVSRVEGNPAGPAALKDFLTLYHYGYSLQQVGRLEDAVRAYDRSIQLRNDYSFPVINRGVVLAKLGRPREACRDFQRARDLEPKQSIDQFLRDCK